jgi:hypothetical protein
MKTINRYSKCTAIFAPAVALLFLASCASTQTASTNTKSLLTAAGFQAKTPQTEKQKEIYNGLPPNKIERGEWKGKVFYAYKDEKAGVAYVGHEAEYQRYKQLCQQQKMSQDFYMSENMDRIQTHRWYGEWGAAVVWR